MGREFHVRSHPSPIEHWRHLIEIVAFIVAALWAFYVFIYQERIKPASEELRMQPTVVVHHEMLASGREYVEVRLTLKNLSGVNAKLDGMIINIYGRKFADTPGEHIESALPGITELNRTLTLSNPTLLYSFYDTWEPFGAPPPKSGVIRAGEEFHEVIAFGIKPRSFDIAKINWMYCLSRSNNTWQARRQQKPDGSYAFSNVPLHDLEPSCGGQRRGEYFPL